MKHLANLLTLVRLLLAPVVAWALLAAADDPNQGWAVLAAILFVTAALTDLFDGMAARAFNGESKLGRVLDPIADKALVGLPLVVVSYLAWTQGTPMWRLVAVSSGVIIVRDLLITVLRLTSPDGEGVRVSSLAKWKTTVELVAVAIPILIVAAPEGVRLAGRDTNPAPDIAFELSAILLAIAAAMSAISGLQYLAAMAQKSRAGKS
ncbi:MAG: CDP-diacylglycerol--glycerol-3-phosphate 3-phosphatidyltransferase [Hyphomonadaceae bacterium]